MKADAASQAISASEISFNGKAETGFDKPLDYEALQPGLNPRYG